MSWRVKDYGDGLYVSLNALTTDGATWTRLDVGASAFQVALRSDRSMEWRYAAAGANPIIWTVIGRVTGPGATGTLVSVPPGDIRNYGAAPSASATVNRAAFEAAVAANDLVVVPPLGWSFDRTRITKKCHVYAVGAEITLVGDQAGFVVAGSSLISSFGWYGGLLIGDGVNRDGAVANAQVGLTIGNEAGANVQNALVDGLRVVLANVGLKAAYGVSPNQKLKSVRFRSCSADQIIGTVAGVGYGFQMAQCDDSAIEDCFADRCGRHGIYVSEGRNYRVIGGGVNRNRDGQVAGTVRGGLAISRSRTVTVDGVTFDANNDSACVVDVDAGGLAPDNVLEGVTLRGLVFKDSDLEDIRIGTTNPAADGVPKDVLVEGCVATAKAGNTDPSVSVQCGNRVRVRECTFSYAAAGAARVVALAAAGGNAFSQDLEVIDNQIDAANIGVQIAAALVTGTARVTVERNRGNAPGGMIELVGGAATQTNVNLVAKRAPFEIRTAADLDTTPCVTGIDLLELANTGATLITTFDGGVEGQFVGLHFTNGNTTLVDGATLQLAGGVNFVGSADDVLTIQKRGANWYETARSVN